MLPALKTDRIRTIKTGWLLDGCGGSIQSDIVLEIDYDRISLSKQKSWIAILLIHDTHILLVGGGTH